jgi:hypothetical protein
MGMPSLAEFLAPWRPKPLPPIDVAAVRIRLRMTQRMFATVFGFPLTTLRHWEQETRKPTGAALVLLHVIRQNPGLVRQTLSRIRNQHPLATYYFTPPVAPQSSPARKR